MNVVGGVVVVVLGGADERLKGRFGLGRVGEWSRLMHLNFPLLLCSWVHLQVFPSALSLLAEMGVRLLAAATTLQGQGTPQRSREPGRNMGMFNHQERYKTSDGNWYGV